MTRQFDATIPALRISAMTRLAEFQAELPGVGAGWEHGFDPRVLLFHRHVRPSRVEHSSRSRGPELGAPFGHSLGFAEATKAGA